MKTVPEESLRFSTLVPSVKRGVGVLQNTYGGGRVGASINHFGGLNQVVFWGSQPTSSPCTFFRSDATSSYQRCFRAELLVEGQPYVMEFHDTQHFPFGYVSRFTIPGTGVELRHRLTLLNDALVFSVEVLKNPRRLRLRQRFEHHDYCREGKEGAVSRTFSPWESGTVSHGWTVQVKDQVSDAHWEEIQASLRKRKGVGYPLLSDGDRSSTTFVTFLGDQGLEMRTSHSGRRYFLGGEFRSGLHACTLLFTQDRKSCVSRAEELLEAGALALAQEKHFAKALKSNPTFRSGDAVFDSMLANVPPMLESLMMQDLKGAMRAVTMHYGIWGWDTLMGSEAYLLGNKADFVREALAFYKETADPEYGVGHMFTRGKPRVRTPMAPSAQLLYLIVLYQYGVHTGDFSLWKDFYEFARWVFQLNLADVNEKGLGSGPALFPDFPEFAGHNGHDISVFNNSLLYQGARCMEEMAASQGDTETEAQAAALSRKLEKNFSPAFWDKRHGYFVDSIDTRSGAARKSYPGHALLWQTPFLSDLAGEKLAACGEFQAKNLSTDRGFLMYPRWDAAFDGDGNQMAQIWSTHDAFILRCQAKAGREDILSRWVQGCSYFWNLLTYIEGYSCQSVNDGGTPDLPGGKQPFGAKSIYMAFFTGLAGLHFDIGGLTFEEGSEREVGIDKLPFRGRQLQITLKGKGSFPKHLLVDGKAITGTRKVPLKALRKRSRIVFERTSKRPKHPVLLSFYGATLDSSDAKAGRLSVSATGATASWLSFFAPAAPQILVNGQPLKAAYDPATGLGRALVPLSGKSTIIEISV